MSSNCCYNASDFERELNKFIPQYTPQKLAWLIGHYNENHKDSPINREDLSATNINAVVQELNNYQQKEAIKSLSKQIRNSQTNLTTAFTQLLEAIPNAVDLHDVYRYVSDIFSFIAQKNYEAISQKISCTKEQYINGFVSKKVSYGGEAFIFYQTFKLIAERMLPQYPANSPQAELLTKCLENFPAICVFARKELIRTEGVSSVMNDFAEKTNTDFYAEDNNLGNSLDIEEMKPEHWAEQSDCKNPRASRTANVKKCLRIMPLYKTVLTEDGPVTTRVKTALNTTRCMSEEKVYRQLKNLCRGCTTSDSMMNAIKNADLPYIHDLMKQIEADTYLKTSLFEALRKNNQLYAVIKDTLKKGIHTFETKIANPLINPVAKIFTNGVHNKTTATRKSREVIGPDGQKRQVHPYLFENDKIDMDTKKALFNPNTGVARFFLKSQNAIGAVNNWKNLPLYPKYNSKTRTTTYSKYDVIREIFETLGLADAMESAKIDVDSIIIKILESPTNLRFFVNTVEDALTYIQNQNITNLSLSSLFEIKDNGSSSPYAISIEKLLGLIGNISGTAFRQQSVKYFNSKGDTITMFSDVVPFSMADKMEKIKEFVTEDNAEGLIAYMDAEFKSNPIFYDASKSSEKEKWLNSWMYELYNSTFRTTENDFFTGETREVLRFRKDSFAEKFAYRRMLGQTKANKGKPFEDFSLQTHAVQILASFFSEKKDGYAICPVFTLADSMIERELKVPVYPIQSSRISRTSNLHDLLWQTYQSELNRQAQVKKFNQWCDENHLERIENYSKTENKFSYLTFLNGLSEDKLPKTKDEFNILLDEFMSKTIGNVNDNVTTTYDGKPTVFAFLKANGVLEKNSSGKYLYVNNLTKSSVGKGETADEALQRNIEYWYWNTFYANIQQFQMFTVDTAFYKDTKDFQKRYKELSAAGSPLDLSATWEGKPVFVDKYGNPNVAERCVYFNDISINAENSNPEFMEVIIRTFCNDKSKIQDFYSKYEVSEDTYLEKNPTNKEAKKKERDNALKAMLGEIGYKRYKAYQDNTLTDGQGYRSLDSYRKIAIGSNQWTDSHEKWYKKIKALQEKAKTTPLTSADYASLKEGAQIILQPLKPYYFGMEHKSCTLADDSNFNIAVPVQHKYAEVVLIPILLPEGSKLREMAEFMENQEVDMMCSTKCVKVGNFAAVDIDNLQDGETLTDRCNASIFANPETIHTLSLENYRIQTNVPEHSDVNQLFGTQIRKLIMANIKIDGDYSHYFDHQKMKMADGSHSELKLGTHLVRFYNSLIVANILQDFKKFEMAVSDLNKVSQILQKGVLNNDREVLSRIMDYALTGDMESTLIPLIDPFISHDAVAQILSIYKKQVNKQRIKGGAAVQASAFGLTKMEAKGTGKRKNDIENAGDLKMIVSADKKNILYMECEMPFIFNIGGKDLQFDDYCNEDGTLKMNKDNTATLIEEEFPGILDIVAYRIPTEKHYSMLNLKVVRFSRPDSGGTLKVPAQCTTIAGFDFDIDKLYFFKKEFRVKDITYKHSQLKDSDLVDIWARFYTDHLNIKEALSMTREGLGESYIDADGKLHTLHPLNYYWDAAGIPMDKQAAIEPYIKEYCEEENINLDEVQVERTFDTYDPDKTPLENSKAARNNMLLHIIQQRLMDPETLKSRITPGGYENPKNAARIMARLMSPEITKANLDLNTLKNQALQDKIIKEPAYNPCDPITNLFYTQQNQIAGKLIGVFANESTNHAFCTILEECKLHEPIAFMGHKFDDFIHPSEGRDVDLYVAEYLAASVDAIKDPVLKFLNFNTLNADTGATMARLGYTTYEIGLLFSQPILQEIWTYAANNKCNIKTAISGVKKQWADRVGQTITQMTTASQAANIQVTINDESALVDNILTYKEKPDTATQEFIAKQFAVLDTFEKFLKVSQDMSEFIKITKFTAANSVKSTMGEIYAQQISTSRAIQKYKDNLKADEREHTLSFSIKLNRYIHDDVANGMPIQNNPDFETMSDEEYTKTTMNNPFAFEQVMYDKLKAVLKILEKYIPFNAPVFENARTVLTKLYKFGTPSGKIIDKLHSSIITDMLQHDSNGTFNPEAQSLIKMEGSPMQLNKDFYSNPNMVEEFFTVIYDLFSENDEPLPITLENKKITDSEGKTHLVKTIDASRVLSATTEEQEQFILKWVTLSNSNKEVVSKFKIMDGEGNWRNLKENEIADMLYFYYYYKGNGMFFNPTGVLSLAPTSLKTDLIVKTDSTNVYTYPDFLKSLSKRETTIESTNKTLFSFITKNTNETNLVYNVIHDESNGSLYNALKSDIAESTSATKDTIILHLDSKKYENYYDLLVRSETKDDNYFVPAIKIDDDIYICVPQVDNPLNKIGSNGSIVLVKYVPEEEYSGEITAMSEEEASQLDSTEEEESADAPDEQEQTNNPAIYSVKNMQAEDAWKLFRTLVIQSYDGLLRNISSATGQSFDVEEVAHKSFTLNFDKYVASGVFDNVTEEQIKKIKDDIDNAFTPGSSIQGSLVVNEKGEITDIHLCC